VKPLLIVVTGHAPETIRARFGDFDHWFRLALGLPAGHLRTIDVQAGQALPPPRMCAGAVITGSGAMVTERERWSEQTAGWIRDAMDTALPLFGVCYGHQLMAHALGGRVDYLPGGREIGTQGIEAREDLSTLARPSRWRAHTTHLQSVLETPPGARVLASSARDPHQLFAYGEHALSTQYHPEFSAEVMRAYVRERAPRLREEGLDVAALLRATSATPQARAMLRRFARRCASPTAASARPTREHSITPAIAGASP
jgi:GMP synthase (glutamine-hydrolysing)